MTKQDDYTGLIEQLLPLYQSPQFDALLNRLTAGEPNSSKLLIKIEINRLMAPCQRSIDLRGKVKGDCREYTLDGLKHWLDDVAINHYHKRIAHYGGKLTVGLWDELHNTPNNFRVLHQKEKQQLAAGDASNSALTHPSVMADVLRFGHYLSRSESRVHLSTGLFITLPDGQEVHGVTSDISNSGCRVKMPAAFDYELGAIIVVEFRELASQYEIEGLTEGLDYRVVGIDDGDESGSFIWLRLRLETNSDAVKRAIDLKTHSPNFKKRRDNEDKVLSIRSRAFEQTFLQHTSHLPLFFSGNELKYCLLTDHNKSLWEYWHDERNQPLINQIFNPRRIEHLLVDGAKSSQILLYCFSIEQQNKQYFYSASPSELTAEQRVLFWHIGAHRPSWRVFRITVSSIVSQDLDRLQDASPDRLDRINELTHIALIQDITVEQGKDDYLNRERPNLPSAALREFLHPRDPVCQLQVIPPQLKPQRREPRYRYRSRLSLVHAEFGAIQGQSVDFSSKGLNLKVIGSFNGTCHDVVSVTFDDFIKLDENAPLRDIPYQVVRISPDRTNVQLKLVMDEVTRKRSHYLQRLIKHNASKLIEDAELLPDAPLVEAMHQMLLTRLISTPYFVAREETHLSVTGIGANFPTSAFNRLLETAGDGRHFSLFPVFKDKLIPRSHDVTRVSHPASNLIQEYYIWADIKDNTLRGMETVLFNDFESEQARREFVMLAKTNGQFFAVRNCMVPIQNGSQFLEEEEMSVLVKFATHKARLLETEFSTLCAYGELSDITDEVLLRMGV